MAIPEVWYPEAQTPSPEMSALEAKVLVCYQCGTCTASCPVAGAMDYSPRQIMRLIQAGLEEQVLRSETIWTCASCYSCAARCPRGIEITDIMAELRHLAMRKGYRPKASVSYFETFMDIVRRHGRMSEWELVLRYNLSAKPLLLVKMASIGLTMLRKGKIALIPDKSPRLDDVRGIFAAMEKGRRQR